MRVQEVPHIVWVFALVVLLLVAYVALLVTIQQDNEALKGLLIAGAGALWGISKNATTPSVDARVAGDLNVDQKENRREDQ